MKVWIQAIKCGIGLGEYNYSAIVLTEVGFWRFAGVAIYKANPEKSDECCRS